MTRSRLLLLLAALAVLVTGCAASARPSATPTADESPVPDGMPVMYEFFTQT